MAEHHTGVWPEQWHQFAPGQRVLTREGLPGRVDSVEDGPSAGNERYLVTLDAGLGGGEYDVGELSPLGEPATAAVAAVEQTAAHWYPELGEVLLERPPPELSMAASLLREAALPRPTRVPLPADIDPDERAGAIRTVERMLGVAFVSEPDYAEPADSSDTCICCAGTGEHQTGAECVRCDASGQESAAAPGDPVPCEGTAAVGPGGEPLCPRCGVPVEHDPQDGWQHADGSIGHWDEFEGGAPEAMRANAGYIRDLLKTPTEEVSFDWCRFRRANHCWYPRELDRTASTRAGYAVWVPQDRGRCPRASWELQQQCFNGGVEYLTYDGVRTLKETSGTTQLVLTVGGVWRDAEIRSFGQQPLFRVVITRKGEQREVFATAGHRWFVKGRRRDTPRTNRQEYRLEKRTWVDPAAFVPPTYTAGQHRLSDVDESTRTAHCSVCASRVAVYPISKTRRTPWRCDVARRESKARSQKRASAAGKAVLAGLMPGDRLASVLPHSLLGRWYPNPTGVAAGFVYGDGSREGNDETYRGNGCKVTLWGEKDAHLAPYFAGCRSRPEPTDGVKRYTAGVSYVGLPGFFKDRPSLHESAEYLYGWLAGYFAADGNVTSDGTPILDSHEPDDLEFVRSVCNRLTIATYSIKTKTRLGYRGRGLIHDNNVRLHGHCALERGSEIHSMALVASTVRPELFLIPTHRARFEARRTDVDQVTWRVVSIESTDRVEEVYCAVVPRTTAFALDGNILTGNCPIGEPGPHAGGYNDATVPWSEGGQHGGRPTPGYRVGSLSILDSDPAGGHAGAMAASAAAPRLPRHVYQVTIPETGEVYEHGTHRTYTHALLIHTSPTDPNKPNFHGVYAMSGTPELAAKAKGAVERIFAKNWSVADQRPTFTIVPMDNPREQVSGQRSAGMATQGVRAITPDDAERMGSNEFPGYRLPGHNTYCTEYAMQAAAENGAEDHRQEYDWARQYLQDGTSDCLCREYPNAPRAQAAATEPVDQNRSASARDLTNRHYELADAAQATMEKHEGQPDWSPSELARKLRLPAGDGPRELYPVLEWMVKNQFLRGAGNGRRRRYSLTERDRHLLGVQAAEVGRSVVRATVAAYQPGDVVWKWWDTGAQGAEQMPMRVVSVGPKTYEVENRWGERGRIQHAAIEGLWQKEWGEPFKTGTQATAAGLAPCPGAGQPWQGGTVKPICPTCHRGPGGLGVKEPARRRRGGGWSGVVPQHDRKVAQSAATSSQPRATDPKPFRVRIQHGQEMPINMAFASPDTARKWVRDAYKAGADTARITRHPDGAVIYDPHAGIDVDYRDVYGPVENFRSQA